MFDADDIARYQAVLRRMAVPYRVDARGRPTRSEFSPSRAIDAATGIITTVHDLAQFDIALDRGVLLRDDVINFMRGGPAPGAPTGIGWFVQSYNGERIVWHFGSEPGAYSSLILKVPRRDVTLILLANSDGLAGPPFNLADGNLSSNLFASLFLKLFVG
jgi:CubicO group peptidase (beta-lactamase class C family)